MITLRLLKKRTVINMSTEVYRQRECITYSVGQVIRSSHIGPMVNRCTSVWSWVATKTEYQGDRNNDTS